MREKDLDFAFAQKLKSSPEFFQWILARAGFAAVAPNARLLHAEQAAARPAVDAAFWYRYWWCKLSEGGAESETDILALFEASNERFALHIENKPPGGRFTDNQEKNYPLRAAFMATKLPITYTRWATVLVAPQEFSRRHSARCSRFDSFISYEEVARHVPEFGLVLHSAGKCEA